MMDDRCIFCKPAAPFSPNRNKDVPPESEDIAARMFMEAMADVKPICRNNTSGRKKRPASQRDSAHSETTESIGKLTELITHGNGFIVSQTPEYVESIGYRVPPSVTRRLHQGDFSMQAYIDLHGMIVSEAKDAFELFLKEAVSTGKRAVLIVHGRGLSSPGRPVLKHQVIEWLTSGTWRKWVIAFTSARQCDGGAGALYVLLRHRPITKRHLKPKKSAELAI